MFDRAWMLIIMTTVATSVLMVRSFPEADKVKSLPGQSDVSFQQFAGYVAVDDNNNRALFYYFVEAQTNPASKPLVLWLNGGLGCSSVGVGAFTEHGPFLTNQGQAIVQNQYSWNKVANILYVESPAGAGFSYSLNLSFYKTVNDKVTARDSLVFLQRWFAKFPEYTNRDFYITGESYAGHYVPQLAELIVKSKVNFNLRGIALGNPLLDLDTDMNAVDEYYWSHGIISDYAYKISTSLCNSSRRYRENFSGHHSTDCLVAAQKVSEEYSSTLLIDKYYVIGDRCLSYNLSQASFLSEMLNLGTFRLRKSSHNVQQIEDPTDQMKQPIDECNLKYSEMYLNRKDVQKALHARLVGTTDYRLCNKILQTNYERSDIEIPTTDVIGFLVKSGLRVTVYSGDQDSVVPFMGTRRLIDGLAKKLALKTTLPYTPWILDNQVGGWTQVYGNQVTYATIRGASHETPATQPRRSFVLFNAFVEGKPLPKAS
ncbi:serine carboxypeptidase-like 45 isoform X2 [Cajanus cajan]|uniref:serine carboxypeptidase-like 45 isoform X2 n=1 Tax=Cajanus cajan TaxID=3821 RepID=UPI00098D801A|nr:serine carboxypeptidase-like 45 isoform X2 [Cajanus cajan]